MTEDLPGVIIGLLLIFFTIRYFYPCGNKTSGPTSSDGTPTSGVLRGISSSQIAALHQTFPHISTTSIIYSLSRTHSVERTGEEVIERGFLPEPPSTFPIHPYLTTTSPTASGASTLISAPTSTAKSPLSSSKYPSLIEKYNLRDRIADQSIPLITAAMHRSEKGKGRESAPDEVAGESLKLSLAERKEKLILDSRRAVIEKLLKEKETQRARNDSEGPSRQSDTF